MTPAFQILANGADASGAIRDRLISLEAIDEDGLKSDRLEIELDDRDGRIEWPELDARLELSLGHVETGLTPIGVYAVDGVSGEGPGQTMRISATAADMKSTARAPRTRAWRDVSLADIVRTIAAEAGLEAVVGESLAAIRWPYIAQTAESNLHLLTRLAAPLDATAKPAGGKLVVQRRGEGKTAAGDAIVPVALSRARLSAWRWQLGEREKYVCVEAEWSDIGAGATRKIVVGKGEPKRRLRHVYATEAEARRAARGELDLAGRSALQLSGDVAGFEPGLFAGGTLRISDLRPELSGDWQVTRVAHRLGAGLATSFDARKAQE